MMTKNNLNYILNIFQEGFFESTIILASVIFARDLRREFHNSR